MLTTRLVLGVTLVLAVAAVFIGYSRNFTVTVRVTNERPEALHGALVRVDQRVFRLGDVPPGETRQDWFFSPASGTRIEFQANRADGTPVRRDLNWSYDQGHGGTIDVMVDRDGQVECHQAVHQKNF